MSDNPYARGSETPAPVPPNRAPPVGRSAVLWVVLLIVFGAVYSTLTDGRSQVSVEVHDESGARWPLTLPPVVFALCAAAFANVRTRLPAKYRTFELRIQETKPPEPAPTGVPSPFAPLDLRGTNGQRPARVLIDESGFLWTFEKRLLQEAQELHVAWDELQGLSTASVWSSLSTWGLVALGMSAGLVRISPLGAGAGAVAGLGLVYLGRRARRGVLTIVTVTHSLVLHARGLDETARLRLMQALKERRPALVPAEGQVTGWKAVAQIFTHGWREAVLAIADDARLDAELRRPANTVVSEEDRFASVVQRRLFAIWHAAVLLYLPLSLGLTAGLLLSSVTIALAGWFVAWFAALIVSAKSLPLLARLTGLAIVK